MKVHRKISSVMFLELMFAGGALSLQKWSRYIRTFLRLYSSLSNATYLERFPVKNYRKCHKAAVARAQLMILQSHEAKSPPPSLKKIAIFPLFLLKLSNILQN